MKNIFRNTQQDEWQRATEAKVAKNSLTLAFVVVIAGGLTMNHHQWASPLWVAMAEAGLVLWWYMAQVIWRGAYFTPKVQQNAWALAMCGLMLVVLQALQIQSSVSDANWLWNDCHVGSGLGTVLTATYFITLELIGFIRYRLDRRAENAPDED